MYGSSSESPRGHRAREAAQSPRLALCIALGLSLWGFGAKASPAKTEASETRLAVGPKPTARAPEKATFFADGMGKGQTKAVAAALERALATRAEVELTPIKKLVGPGDRLPVVKEAFAKIDKGEMDLANMEIDKGLRAVAAGIKELEKSFDVVGPDRLLHARYVKALTTLGLAYFLAGDNSKTSEWLSCALVMNPKTDYDKKRFPPRMKKVFDTVHFFIAEVGKGKGRVDTSPSGALVSINGKAFGRAPTIAEGLQVGRNLVTVTAMGYQPQTVVMNVQGGKTVAVVKVSLKKLAGDPMAQLSKASTSIMAGGTSASKTVARSLGVELLLLAKITGAADRFQVKLYAYDAKIDTIVGRAKGTINTLEAEKDINKLVDSLFAAIRVTRSPPKPEPKRPGFFSRMVSSKWFWPVVGAVAGAAVIAGATVGIVLATSGDNTARNAILLPAFSSR